MYVCLCNAVTDRDILNAAREGCANLDELAVRTGCGSGCGCCREMAASLLLESGMSPASELARVNA